MAPKWNKYIYIYIIKKIIDHIYAEIWNYITYFVYNIF